MKPSVVLFFLIFSTTMCLTAQTESFTIGENFYYEEEYQKAKPHFEAFLNSNPNHLKAKEYLGDIAVVNSDWETALTYYKSLLDAHPDNANYNFKYGGVLGRKAQSISRFRAALYINEIESHLIKAAKLDPNHIEARWALIDLYIALPTILGGSESTALKYANELMKISEVDGYLTLGYIAEHFNRPRDAEKNYKKAMQIGQSPLTYEKLADLYENKTGEPVKAMKIREASAKRHKRNSINYQIGKISAMYNIELEKGLNYLKAYLKNYTVRDGVPKEWAYYRIAQIYRHMGDKRNAMNWSEKALLLNKDFQEAHEEQMRIQRM